VSASPAAAESPTSAALLALPAVAGLSPTWRRVLDAAMPGEGEPAGLSDTQLPILSDTLASLQRLNAEGDVILAAILHDLPDWRARIEPRLAKEWPSLATLLDGQRAAAQVWTLHAAEAGGRNAEGLRRLLLAIVRDLRVVPVLLARQLAQLRAAGKLPEAERKALARLTRDIHAPLANRLGIWQLKWELEDLAFRHLEPQTFQQIARWLDEKRGGRERYIEQVKRTLGDALKAQGIEADVAGRPKHITSIWKKMQKKGVPIDELYDLRAVRVLVKDIPACYAALGIVHALWVPIPSEFDDYIARPKRNDYRSLHTAVIGPEGKTLEVQIRTEDMHAQAELGVAAHWRYKEGRSAPADAGMDRKIEWMRKLLDGGRDDSEGAEESLHSALDSELVEDRIYTLTPQGDVVDLPNGATPLDFAYHVHTMVGHRCRGAKVDGRIVPLDYKLRTGQRIEILTAKTAEPRRDWLLAANGFLASGRSRDKVRAWFHKLDRARNLQAGREMLDKDLRRMSLLHADLAPVLSKFNAANVDELYVHVALGDVSPHQIGRALLDHERAQQEAAQASTGDAIKARAQTQQKHDTPRAAPKRAQSDSAFTVVGVGNLLVQIARCCQPLPGEAIAGYLTRARGVSVHRADCAAFLRLSAEQPQRVLSVEWGRTAGSHVANVVVEAVDRRWLLKDVSNLIAQDDAHVISINTDAMGGSRVRLRMQLRVRDHDQLARLLGRIDSLSGVEEVRRA
jgi:GTP pyrophosphokinase